MYSLSKYNRLLIIQTSFIGDVALSLYLVSVIKKFNPKCEIHYLVNDTSKHLLKISTDIDKIIPIDKKKIKSINQIFNFTKDLNKNNYDLVINLHKSFRSFLIAFKLSAKLKITYSDAIFSFFYAKRVQFHRHLHEWQRALFTLSVFKEYNQELIKKVPNLGFDTSRENQVVLAPTSAWTTKQYTKSGFVEIVNYLVSYNIKVAIIGSNQDKEYCDEFVVSDLVTNYCGILSLDDSVRLISKSLLVISNDSAPTHFASITNTPTITIFGPTVPEFGFSPLADNSHIVQNDKLNCRPCHHHGLNKCPLWHHECMNDIRINNITDKITDILRLTKH
jgi:heptosyltransferase-2